MRIYSIFNSIDGEINHFGQGSFTTFIRVAGCNLRCNWCDTKYAQDPDSGSEMTIDRILQKVEGIRCKKITITGGEPLLQPNDILELTKRLWHKGYQITIETNGTKPLEGYGINSWVVDYKLPSTGVPLNVAWYDIVKDLRRTDFLKFVIQDKADYEYAKYVIKDLQKKGNHAQLTFSPVHGVLVPERLIEWMKEDYLFNVRLNIQLHKYILPNEHK